MLVKKEVEVSKEASELADALYEIVKVSKQAVADGFQAGTDLPAIVVGSMPKLMAAVDGLDKLGDEVKEDPAAFAKALAMPSADIMGLFLKKADA